MANNVLQIKRTSVSGRAANTTTLTNPGELALNMTDGIMYSTNGSVVFQIGANLTSIAVGNTTARFTANTLGAYHTGTVNATSLTVGSSFIANTTRVVIGTAVGLQANGGIGTAGQVLHSNGTTAYWAADDQGVTSIAAANGLNGGTITSTGTISVLGGSTLTVNTTGAHVNSTLSITSVNAASHTVGTAFVANSTQTTLATPLLINNDKQLRFQTTNTSAYGYFVQQSDDNFVLYTSNTTYGARPVWSVYANTANSAFDIVVPLKPSGGLVANGTAGSAGQVLKSNGGNIYWDTAGGTGTVTSVATANGLSGGTITSTGTIGVTTGSTLTVNTTGIHVNSTLSIASVNADSHTVGSAFIANSTGITTTGYANVGTTLQVGTNTATFGTAAYIVANGNFGIGTSTPSSQLSMYSATSSTLNMEGDALVQLNLKRASTGGFPSIFITKSRGTIAARTAVASGDAIGGIRFQAFGGTNDRVVGNILAGVESYVSDSDISSFMYFATSPAGTVSPAERMRIVANGNVGINTPTPGSTITVNGTASFGNTSITDLVVSGNLTVSGTRTYVNTTTLDVGDNIITLNADLGASAPSENAGIEIMRGTSSNVQFIWDETNDRWSTNAQPLAVSSLIPSANIILGSAALSSNGSLGTAGHVLHSNGTATYWAADDQGVTSVVAANGLNGGTITSTGTMSVLGGSTLTVNTTGVHVNTALALTSLATTSYVSVGNSTVNTYITGTQVQGNQNDTVSAPAYSWSTDTTTGIYRPAASTIGVAIAGVHELTINATSFVANGLAFSGIGTLAAGNTTITGFANVSTTLQVTANATVGGDFIVSSTYPRIWLNDTNNNSDYSIINTDGNFSVYDDTNGAHRLWITAGGNVGLGTTTPGYKLEVNGSFAATTKSFIIPHPTKPGMKLRYGSLEGPENGVYVRGRLRAGENIIQLPDYWEGLVDEDTYTVNLTPVGKHQELYVKHIASDYIIVGGEDIDCFYTVFAERNDVDKLEVEF